MTVFIGGWRGIKIRLPEGKVVPEPFENPTSGNNQGHSASVCGSGGKTILNAEPGGRDPCFATKLFTIREETETRWGSRPGRGRIQTHRDVPGYRRPLF